MKIIPVYLPQFHCIPENNKWWGDGFTEWVNVKAARPLFEGHYQPRIPLNQNYYNLKEIENIKWQAKIAKEHGIYGWSIYHYWFNGHLLLEKPMELLLAHPEIDIKYCICWANHDWTNSWKAINGRIDTLIAHDFDDEKDWENHFNYMLPFFKDRRYICEDNKPFLTIYIPQTIKKLTKMLSLWNKMAIDNGFDGIKYLYQNAPAFLDKTWDRSLFSYGIQFNPDYAIYVSKFRIKGLIYSLVIRYARIIKRFLHIKRGLDMRQGMGGLTKYEYDEIWDQILNARPDSDNTIPSIPSAYVDWDNTPRRQNRGVVHVGASPEKFKKYFRQLVLNTRKYYHQDKIFFFAWNEWAEGGYLEPDEKFGYAYLEAVRDVLIELKEME